MGIQGRIGKTTPIEVISFLNSAEVTGTLTFKGISSIDLIFECGSIVGYYSNKNHASVHKQIAKMNAGSYSFNEHTLSNRIIQNKTNESIKSFIYLIAKNMDDLAIISDIYDTDMEFEISKNFTLDNITLDVNEWRIIAILSNRTDIKKIKSVLNLSYLKISKILFSLEQIGIIKRVRKKASVGLNSKIIKSMKLFLSNTFGKALSKQH